MYWSEVKFIVKNASYKRMRNTSPELKKNDFSLTGLYYVQTKSSQIMQHSMHSSIPFKIESLTIFEPTPQRVGESNFFNTSKI